MISKRTRYSLAQFLEQLGTTQSITLFSKYNAEHVNLYPENLLFSLTNIIRDQDENLLLLVLREIITTSASLRAKVSPKIIFDERIHDLTQCLLMDGYIIQGKKLMQADPSISDAAPLEDDLIAALKESRIPQFEAIIKKINASADAFCSPPPDYNAALTNARVAIEALAVDIAAEVAHQQQTSGTYNEKKWGEVIGFLRKSGEISMEEEKGLVGVYGFLSPGAHRPIGIPENHMARLGRSFSLNMCWFLLQNRLARRTSKK
ncbi:hypothetical protein AA303_17795 [Pseudomonas psychrophila]|uniref:hypothetical protein n=1 Tax=Pseudomonas psychrophila TaxID=122355 RepID=UPI00062A0C91|nr:hypothetical protein [Pseudomonas psychrophila]KOX63732.1 hypothetical protein AA303_17795 [Pseudomonas psychrophila]